MEDWLLVDFTTWRIAFLLESLDIFWYHGICLLHQKKYNTLETRSYLFLWALPLFSFWNPLCKRLNTPRHLLGGRGTSISMTCRLIVFKGEVHADQKNKQRGSTAEKGTGSWNVPENVHISIVRFCFVFFNTSRREQTDPPQARTAEIQQLLSPVDVQKWKKNEVP